MTAIGGFFSTTRLLASFSDTASPGLLNPGAAKLQTTEFSFPRFFHTTEAEVFEQRSFGWTSDTKDLFAVANQCQTFTKF